METKTQAGRRRRREGGFTLVELLIVVAILAVLVAVVLPNFTGLLGGSQTSAADAELVIVQTAVDAKMADQSMASTTAVAETSDMASDPPAGFGLHPTYMRSTATNGTYTVTDTGQVSRVTTGY